MIDGRLRAAKGPVTVLIPARDMSQLAGRKTFDLAGKERGSWTQAETDRILVETLRRHLPEGLVQELPLHINDAAFADACVDAMTGFLRSGAATPARR